MSRCLKINELFETPERYNLLISRVDSLISELNSNNISYIISGEIAFSELIEVRATPNITMTLKSSDKENLISLLNKKSYKVSKSGRRILIPSVKWNNLENRYNLNIIIEFTEMENIVDDFSTTSMLTLKEVRLIKEKYLTSLWIETAEIERRYFYHILKSLEKCESNGIEIDESKLKSLMTLLTNKYETNKRTHSNTINERIEAYYNKHGKYPKNYLSTN